MLGWRDVPTDNRLVGDSARATQPVFEQVFIGAPARSTRAATRPPTSAARVRTEALRHPQARRARGRRLKMKALSRRFFYIVSLSANALIYKGMLQARQLEPMFPDLSDESLDSRRWRWCTSGSARTRSRRGRWRTRTAMSRTTARSTRCAATSTGCTRARGCSRAICSATTWSKLLPIIREGGSDTATFDNVLELLVMAGRSLPHAILMMIPEPWSNHESMSPERKAFYRLSRVADGAVGRPGLDRLHRRHGDRRGARPQRPASVALLRDQGRPGHHGVRSRRARHPAARRPRQGAPAPGQDLPRRYGRRAGSSTTRRSSASWRRSIPYREWLDDAHRSTSTICRPRGPSSPSTRPCSTASRRSATRRKTSAS